MSALLDVDGVSAGYGDVSVLRGVRVAVGHGEAVALLGANGAGKSTLMRSVIGLLRARAGTIRFEGRRLDTLPPDRRARLGIGYCPEGRRPFPGLTVAENLAVACWDDAAIRARRTEEVYALFPALRDHRARPAWQLSGGQQQMVALGRALMNAPRLLLLDEPSLGLSPRLAAEVIGRIPLIRRSGCAVLMAEQNAAQALGVCDTAYVMRGGQVVQHGRATELARDDAVRAAFLGGPERAG